MFDLDFDTLQNNINIAEHMTESQLHAVGQQVVKGFRVDEDSRAEWKMNLNESMNLAKQTLEDKTFPWPGCSNIKYPLIKKATINYASRTLPELFPSNRVVKCETIGLDPDGSKYQRSENVATFLSYILTCADKEWYSGIDQLLHTLPIVGTMFKKTYYDVTNNEYVSELCSPDKIVVNYSSISMAKARRVTQILKMYTNDVIERQNSGIFLESIDPESLRPTGVNYSSQYDQQMNPSPTYTAMEDDDFPIELLEQHCWMDLDGDGYKEPYVVTVHLESEQVFRIVNRFKSVIRGKKDRILKILPHNFFTMYKFFPSDDGGFYGQGFGQLLLPLNKATNSLFNQLLDAGTLANLQGGFIGKGIRIKDGEFTVQMGEWKVLDAAAGSDLKNNIVPFPTKEPSHVLLDLLTMLIKMGEDLASSTEALTGQQPAQNVANGVYQNLIEQGTMVFKAINKRVYKSLTEDYQKLYELFSQYGDNKYYQAVLGDPRADMRQDFELGTMNVYPVADPELSTETQRLNRALVLQQLRGVDIRAADMFLLKSLRFEDAIIKQLLPPPNPNQPPPAKDQRDLAAADADKAKAQNLQVQTQILMQKAPIEAQNAMKELEVKDSQIKYQAGLVWQIQANKLHGDQKILLAGGKMTHQESLKDAMAQHQQQVDAANISLQANKQASETQKNLMKAALENKKIDKMSELKSKEDNNTNDSNSTRN